MMAAKHTPGPWSHSEDFTFIAADAVEIGAVQGYVSPSEKAANARLIVAAPDLLDALREVTFLAECCGSRIKFKPRQIARIARANAAIRLAETGQRA